MKILIISLLISTLIYSKIDKKFVNPLTYDGSYKQKLAVVNYIKMYTSKKIGYSETERRQILRIIQYKEAMAFRKLMRAKNKKILNKTIKQLCDTNQCSYLSIWLIYDQRIRALTRPKYIYDANKTFNKNNIDSYY
jgi:hypothetical protein